jgi:hypothetical protein
MFAIVSLANLKATLPAKLMLSVLFGSDKTSASVATSFSGRDCGEEQLQKDLARDRVVVHGRRMAGATHPLSEMIDHGVLVAQTMTKYAGGRPFAPDLLSELVHRALSVVSRTESAFVSHYALQALLNPSTDPNIIIVPEASLAQPLLMQFRVVPSTTTPTASAASSLPSSRPVSVSRASLSGAGISAAKGAPPTDATPIKPARRMSAFAKMEEANSQTMSNSRSEDNILQLARGDSASDCGELESMDIICDVQGTTVFRFVDADTMEGTFLQVKVTFCKSIKLKYQDPAAVSAAVAASTLRTSAVASLNPFGEASPRSGVSTNPFGEDTPTGSDQPPAGETAFSFVDNDDDQSSVDISGPSASFKSAHSSSTAASASASVTNQYFVNSTSLVVIEQETSSTNRDWL